MPTSAEPTGVTGAYDELAETARSRDGKIDRDRFRKLLGLQVAEEYAGENSARELMEFSQGTGAFIFDQSQSIGGDRTILASCYPEPPAPNREDAYQRAFPISETLAGRALDRGHFVPHTSGGLLGPNLFAQDRALNRGWSRDGRAYRALETLATRSPGNLFFAHPQYTDASDVPTFITIGVVTSEVLTARRFRNRYDQSMPPDPDLQTYLHGATDARIGELGEETAIVLLERLGATIVSTGDGGRERNQSRQQLDILAVLDGDLTAIEVKTRYNSNRAGHVTRAGNLSRPRLRRPSEPSRYRQGSQPYLAQRISDYVDVADADFQGIDVLVAAIDLHALLVQFFSINDRGTRPIPVGRPMECESAAQEALQRIIGFRCYL